ncbi:MAG: polyprenyl synthetase family protein [Nannocystaceae bacterium]|nr:polyprenyl synthetase family protein [bacterium]
MTPTHISISTLPAPSTRPFHVFLEDVEAQIERRLTNLHAHLPAAASLRRIAAGKKLRTRMVAHLADARLPSFDRRSAVAACAATELVHSASLCHDDIIDEADERRGAPTVWRQLGVPGAILVGDLLLVDSFGALARAGHVEAVADFVDTLRKVAGAEMDQELRHRGACGDLQRWREVCEGKTGVLFAFPARWACPADRPLAHALERCARSIGTAYQMHDDLLDIHGDAEAVGKTLGQDRARGKHTIPAAPGTERAVATAAIEGTIREALASLEAWPRAQQAMERFVARDLRACLRTTGGAPR